MCFPMPTSFARIGTRIRTSGSATVGTSASEWLSRASNCRLACKSCCLDWAGLTLVDCVRDQLAQKMFTRGVWNLPVMWQGGGQ